MLEIVLARHGETDWNAGQIFRGRADVPLNESGLRQAEMLGGYLSRFEIKAVYASPLQRAAATAAAIAEHHSLEVIKADGLVDFDYGEWQGLSRGEVMERYGELYDRWTAHPERVAMPGGERLGNVRERALAVVDDVIRKHDGGMVVLVSHRVVSKVLICALLGLDDSRFWNIRLDTGGITSFNHEEGRFALTGHNNTSFLESMKKAPLADF
jgi:broad specificity phosphatase PhoE